MVRRLSKQALADAFNAKAGKTGRPGQCLAETERERETTAGTETTRSGRPRKSNV